MQCPVLSLMPMFRPLLCETRAVPDHSLNERVCQSKPRFGPVATEAKVTPRHPEQDCAPARQQEELQTCRGAITEDDDRACQFHERGNGEKAPGERERFDRLSLEYTSEQMT